MVWYSQTTWTPYLDEFVFLFTGGQSTTWMLFYPLAAASGGHAASDVWGCRQEHRGELIDTIAG